MFEFDVVIDLLRADGSVVVNKNLARNIGLDCAVVYSELASKYKYFKSKGQLTDDGFFFNTVDNLQFDTCLSEFQQRACIKKLKVLGLVDNRVQGLPAKRYFKIVPNMDTLQKYLQPQEPSQFLKKSITSALKKKEQRLEKAKGNNTKPNNNNEIIITKDKASIFQKDGYVSVDNLTDDSRLVYNYFMRSYIANKKECHPTINKKVVDKLNSLIEAGIIDDPDTGKDLMFDVDDIFTLIDKYFKTVYQLDTGGFADHRIYHFLSDMVLKNLYYQCGLL